MVSTDDVYIYGGGGGGGGRKIDSKFQYEELDGRRTLWRTRFRWDVNNRNVP